MNFVKIEISQEFKIHFLFNMLLKVPPTVIHALGHYIISTIVKTLTWKIMRSRHRAFQEQQGAISKTAPAGISQYRYVPYLPNSLTATLVFVKRDGGL